MDGSNDILFNGVMIRPIPGWEKEYAIDREGNVYSLKRKRVAKTKRIEDQINVHGYRTIKLYKNGEYKRMKVHRLVAFAYIPNPENLPTINHKNEIKTDNRVENLEWSSLIDNLQYGTRTKRAAESLSIPIVSVNLETGEEKRYSSMISAKKDGYDQGCISRCVNGVMKAYKGHKFYKESEYEKGIK